MKSHLALAFAATLVSIALAPAPSLAQTQEEQQACTDDALRFCGHAIPDRDRVAGCLSENFNRISIACRTVMQRYSKPMTATRAKLSTRD